MVVANLATGDFITETWVDSVTNDVNGINTRKGGTWRRAAVQSIPSGAGTLVSWDTEDADSNSYATPTFTTLTIPAGLGGLYALNLQTAWATSALGVNMCRFTISTFTDPIEPAANNAGLDGLQLACAVVPIAAAATLTVSVYQASGAAVNLSRARLDVYRIGA